MPLRNQSADIYLREQQRSQEYQGDIMSNYGYYLPLHPNTFETARFISLAPKTEGFGENEKQKFDKAGVPIWIVSALVKMAGGVQEMENFTLTTSADIANKIKAIEELAPIRLVGLAGGKWSPLQADKTNWTFQVTSVEIIKAQQ